MRIHGFHQFLEIIAKFEIGDYFRHFCDLSTCINLTFGEILDFFRGNAGLLLYIFDPPACISHSYLQIAKLLLILQLLLPYLPSIRQIQLNIVLDLIDPGLYLHHFNLQFLLHLDCLYLKIVNDLRIDVSLDH